MTADEIVFGEMSGMRIQTHTISADRLMGNVGSVLEIGSNKALLLYATKDGSRPAGALDTQGAPTVASEESYITILPARTENNETKPAEIDIMSGGIVNIEGSVLNLKGITHDDSTTNGKINVTSNGIIDISGGKFYLKAGKESLSATSSGLYIGNDGIHFGDENRTIFKIYTDGSNNKKVILDADNVSIGSEGETLGDLTSRTFKCVSTGNYGILKKTYKIGDRWIRTDEGNNVYLCTSVSYPKSLLDWKRDYTTFYCTPSEITEKDYRVGDKWICSNDGTEGGISYKAGNEYYCKNVSNQRNLSSDWSIVSSTSIKGAKINVDANAGTINLESNSSITLTSSNIDMQAGSAFTVSSGNFSIDSNGNVSMTGSITATSGYIGRTKVNNQWTGGWTIIKNRIYSGYNEIQNSNNVNCHNFVALDSNPDGAYAFFAGAKYTDSAETYTDNISANPSKANFYVKKNGDVKAANLQMTGGSIDGPDITIKANSISLYGGNISLSDIGNIKNGTTAVGALNTDTTSATSGIKINNTDGIHIYSGKTVTIESGSNMKIGASGSQFTIGGSTSNGISKAYIYYGKTSADDTQNNGLYLGTDGIIIGRGSKYFKASSDGTVKFTGTLDGADGTFSGSLSAATGEFKGTIKNGSWTYGTTTIPKFIVDSNGLAIGPYWNATAQKAEYNFSVTNNGNIWARSGTIGGWTIDGTSGLKYENTNANYLFAIKPMEGTDTASTLMVLRHGSGDNSKYPFYIRYDGSAVIGPLTVNANGSGKIKSPNAVDGDGLEVRESGSTILCGWEATKGWFFRNYGAHCVCLANKEVATISRTTPKGTWNYTNNGGDLQNGGYLIWAGGSWPDYRPSLYTDNWPQIQQSWARFAVDVNGNAYVGGLYYRWWQIVETTESGKLERKALFHQKRLKLESIPDQYWDTEYIDKNSDDTARWIWADRTDADN